MMVRMRNVAAIVCATPDEVVPLRSHSNDASHRWNLGLLRPDVSRILGPQPDARAIVEPTTDRALAGAAAPSDPHPARCARPICGSPSIPQAKQCRHPAIAIAFVLLGQPDDVFGEPLLVIRPARHLACASIDAARAPGIFAARTPAARGAHDRCIAVAARGLEVSPGIRAMIHPPDGSLTPSSCRISLSNVRSEIARRSRTFSFSRSFIRRA